MALLVGTVVSVALSKALRLQEAFPVGFLAAIVFDQTRFFLEAFRINAEQTREIFGRWLPSRALLLERTVIFTFISVGLLSLCVRDVHNPTSTLPQDWRTFIYFAALFAVWLQMHNGFGIYYAKKYFKLNPAPAADGPDPQGFVFAGSDEPEFTDFLYVSYAVGLTYAMSDTNLEDSSTRRVVLFHSVVSFLFYSTVISAVINLFTSG
ncbi:MAG: DUF1345 domain-containing protein [Synechococcaceae bacterium WB9_4xC_028]|jgi:uncharacterized membrane protein|nr:DUF1345 domain-containing protein [Synechococcaceae bacterium WB9_4xC_028]